MKIVKGTPTESEKRAIEAALRKLSVSAKRVWAAPLLRKEMPTRWR